MSRSLTRSAVLLGATALGAILLAPPALAAPSPAPRVQIGELGPAVVGPDGQAEHWLEVTARDPDGIITEITVEWEGESGTTVIFASRSCFLIPSAPGETVAMSIPVNVPEPGRYQAHVHAHSVESCGDSVHQTGPAKHRRFSVRA